MQQQQQQQQQQKVCFCRRCKVISRQNLLAVSRDGWFGGRVAAVVMQYLKAD
jgi:hypothetical protein